MTAAQSTPPLRILAIGAHPDDCESRAGGSAALWAKAGHVVRFVALADRYRDLLIKRYGEARGRAVRYAEAFEACEYGASLDDTAIQRLFPF